MKNIVSEIVLAATLLVVVSGCSQNITHVPQAQLITSLDFTKYKENNFLMTPGEYGGDYEALGIFNFTIVAEANYEIPEEERKSNQPKKIWVSKDIKAQEVLDLAYETAVKKGADAITHFKMKSGIILKDDGMSMFSIDTLEVSGLLIKRK
ncbi:MAG: hypothetical protein U9N59_01485 [Campylobacterota bacterium]|nr:hypothetical protein [Campylobacterota bacterium]